MLHHAHTHIYIVWIVRIIHENVAVGIDTDGASFGLEI